MEISLMGILLLIVLVLFGAKYGKQINTPAQCDIGYTTYDAVNLLVNQHKDPYKYEMNIYGQDSRFWGYHYGPGMLLFYLPVAWFAGSSLKYLTLIYFALMVGFMGRLLQVKRHSSWDKAGSCIFCAILLFLPERVWFETLVQGSTDFLPVMLIIVSLYFVDNKNFLWAGILAGLSISVKFSPAVFFIILFIRKDFSYSYFRGVFLGSLPLLGYFIWSGMPVIYNAILFHRVKPFDSTSLLSITPQYLHFLFSLFQLAVLLFFVGINFNKSIEIKRLVVHFTLLLICIEATFTEVHANHLLWFIPFLAIIFSWYRYGYDEKDC